MLSVLQPFGITGYHCLPPTPSCFSLKPCLYAVRKMAQYGEEKAGHLVHQICIWPQHMANPGHLTIVLIRTSRQMGASHSPSLCLSSSACGPGANHGHLPFRAGRSLHSFHLPSLRNALLFVFTFNCLLPSNSQAGFSSADPKKYLQTTNSDPSSWWSSQVGGKRAQGLFPCD